LILQELLVPLKLDTSGFDGGIEKAISRGSFFGSFMGNLASTALSGVTNLLGRGIDMVGDFMGDAKEQASDLAESINAVNVVFENGAGIIHEFGKTSADTVGLSSAKFHQLASVTGAFLTNLGLDSMHAADKTIELTKRASDMASVFNTDVADALQAIQSGLKGEFDPLEQFGVKLNAATIAAKAMEMGLADANGELSDSAKAQAALALIMDQTNKLAGDFTNTSDGLANGQRILAARFDDIKARLGTALLPILEEAQKLFLNLIDSDQFNATVDGVIAKIEELSEDALAALPGWFEGARKASEAIATTWRTHVAPTADQIIRLYNNVNAILERLSPGTEQLAGKFTLLGIVQRIAVATAVSVNGALALLRGTLDIMNGALERVINKWESFKRVVQSVANILAHLVIPWWLTPGSPTPLENGLRGIGSALSDLNNNSLPSFATGLNMRQAAPSAGSSIDYHKFARVVAAELAKQYG
jgi:hypothetical protein